MEGLSTMERNDLCLISLRQSQSALKIEPDFYFPFKQLTVQAAFPEDILIGKNVFFFTFFFLWVLVKQHECLRKG